MSVTQRIKKVRKKLSLTQKEFAVALSIPHTSISRYELGSVKPSFDILSKIGQQYKINLNWLLTGDGTMFNTPIDLDPEKANVNVMGQISAGVPVPIDNDDVLYSISIDKALLPKGKTVCFEVNGASMEPRIYDKDLVFIELDPTWEYKENKICAIRVDGEVTLKKLLYKNKIIILMPINDEFEPIVIEDQFTDITMVGAMVLHISKY